MNPSMWFASFWIFLVVLLAGCSGSNSDQDFFNGKLVTIIVPHAVGGGLDTYARAISPFLQKYLPGSKVEVLNISEGSGIPGKNRIFAAQPDGLTLGFTTGAGALLTEWAGQPDVRYKTGEFSWIGRIKAEPHILVVSPQSGFTKLDDIIQAKKIRMGFPGVGTDDYYVALVIASLLNYQVEARTDYLSASDVALACVKDEIDAIQFSTSTILPQIKAQTLVPIVSFGEVRQPGLPDVPTIQEVVPADKQKLIRALVQIYALDRTMIAPPGMPAGRLKVLRTALDNVMADPEFQQNMVKINRPVDYLTGAETANLLANILSNGTQIKALVLQVAQNSK